MSEEKTLAVAMHDAAVAWAAERGKALTIREISRGAAAVILTYFGTIKDDETCQKAFSEFIITMETALIEERVKRHAGPDKKP